MPEAGHEGPVRIHTADLDVARERTSTTFSQVEVQFAGESDLDFHLDIARSPRLTLARMGYGDAATAFGPPMECCYHVNLPMAGAVTAEQNGARRTFTGGAAGIAFQPRAPLKVKLSAGSWQYHLKLPKTLLDAHAAKLVGLPPSEDIEFDLTFDVTSAQGEALTATIEFLYGECCRPGGLATIPKACHEIESALMTQLLTTVPSQLTKALQREPTHLRRAKIREVIEYVDTHPENEITTADLAVMVDLSPRALQAGFRDLVGMSPTAYLRGVRLDRAHLELISGASVTEVATRWGFYHLSRFADQYRSRFGALPSETARGARSLPVTRGSR